MIEYLNDSLLVLKEVYLDKKYVNVALTHVKVSPLVTKIVYGVIENDILLENTLNKLVQKKPNNTVVIILKIGIYLLLFSDNIPAYAVVNECVNLTKRVGKKELAGFVNGVLKKVSSKQVDIDDAKINKPDWFINKLNKTYDAETVKRIVTAKSLTQEHVRINLGKKIKLEEKLKSKNIPYTKTSVGGFYVQINSYIKQLMHDGYLTIMSPSSMLTCQAFNIKENTKLLDMCAAPGGKSIYLSELANGECEITACDIHYHRLNLISSYAKRMGTENIKIEKRDAKIFNQDFENAFDYVLLDAPCSCLGTFLKHPDIFLNAKESNIANLAKQQKEIADNAVRYLKNGGYLIYSTCTIFPEENERVADYIAEKISEDYTDCCLNGRYLSLFDKFNEGFFISRFKK